MAGKYTVDGKDKNGIILPTGQWYAPSTVNNDVWFSMVLHGIAWYCMVLHDIAWYGMVCMLYMLHRKSVL